MKRTVLVVDVGGTWVKLLMSPRIEREFVSGMRMQPKEFLANLRECGRVEIRRSVNHSGACANPARPAIAVTNQPVFRHVPISSESQN